MSEKASFLATFPQIMSAWQIAGDGGARIKLDIPEDQIDEAIRVLKWRDRVLKVTIEPED